MKLEQANFNKIPKALICFDQLTFEFELIQLRKLCQAGINAELRVVTILGTD